MTDFNGLVSPSLVGFLLYSPVNIFSLSGVSPDLMYLLPLALISGPIFGILSIIYMLMLRKSAAFAKTTNWLPWKLLLLAAILTGAVGMFLPEILGLGIEHIENILDDGFPVYYLCLLLLGKLVITSVCIGFGMFGGIFSPALFIGATAGALFTLSLIHI